MQRRSIALTACVGLILMLASHAALAQYTLTNLDSNQVGQARHSDPLLSNAWGLVHGPGTPWWISDNDTGWSTLYDGAGNLIQGLKVSIPTTGNGPASPKGANGPGAPSGIVFNGSNNFQVGGWPSIFLFATLDGTISGWAPQTNFNSAVIGVDNGANGANTGASYTGLAISSDNTRLYAANAANNTVEVYGADFKPVNLGKGKFTDPSVPAGFSVYGIQDINGDVYVTYASTTNGSGGVVDKYSEDGTLVLVNGKSLISGAPLNQAWGVAVAPPNFGKFSNAILVSNNTPAGTINAFTPGGHFIGTLEDTTGKAIKIDQLWSIQFGDGLPMGANGRANQLFFTAGPSNYAAGRFGVIAPAK
jgi:uncharacterized protein (TIGR03118 family)